MTASIKFLGNFVFQADILRPRHRTPERFDVVALTEYEIPTLTRSDLAAGAVVVNVLNDRNTLDKISFDGWNGALWSPLGTITNEYPSDHTLTTLTDYRSGFGSVWARNSSFHAHTDPLRRVYARHLAPTERGRAPNHLSDRKTTITEDAINGPVRWSNRGDALHRHLDASRDLICVDDIIYVRRPDPVWAVLRNKDGGPHAELTIPQFWISSDSDVFPQTYSGRFLAEGTIYRADRAAAALTGGVPIRGEVLALDERFLSRDDAAWTLFCRLKAIVDKTEPLFRRLPANAVVALKTIADAYEASSMWNLSPISVRKEAILQGLQSISATLSAIDCPPGQIMNRDYALKWIDDATEQCAQDPDSQVALHPDDEAGVAALRVGA